MVWWVSFCSLCQRRRQSKQHQHQTRKNVIQSRVEKERDKNASHAFCSNSAIGHHRTAPYKRRNTKHKIRFCFGVVGVGRIRDECTKFSTHKHTHNTNNPPSARHKSRSRVGDDNNTRLINSRKLDIFLCFFSFIMEKSKNLSKILCGPKYPTTNDHFRVLCVLHAQRINSTAATRIDSTLIQNIFSFLLVFFIFNSFLASSPMLP